MIEQGTGWARCIREPRNTGLAAFKHGQLYRVEEVKRPGVYPRNRRHYWRVWTTTDAHGYECLNVALFEQLFTVQLPA